MRGIRALGASCALIAFVALVGVGTSQAATLRVANNGVDGPDCGPLADPCRSIGQAIVNAAPGDKILVGPGRYSAATEPGGTDCLICVDKRVTILSTKGAGVTVIDGQAQRPIVVELDADGVSFGDAGAGFTVVGMDSFTQVAITTDGNSDVEIVGNRTGDRGSGILVEDGIDATVGHNVSIDNYDAFKFDGGVAKLNLAISPNNTSFEIDGPVEFTRNVSLVGGETGFDINEMPAKFEDSVVTGHTAPAIEVRADDVALRRVAAIGNSTGFRVLDSRIFLRHVAVIGNTSCGIRAQSDTTVVNSNIFGNNDTGFCSNNVSNCGIFSFSGDALAEMNFWGGDGEPGPNPSDEACGAGIDTVPFFPAAYSQPFLITPF